ncbi:MAG TPA: glutamate--tRNA ligase [Longimicrobiales bacterium]
MIRVRFAPSPTGYLHVGGARTALFNWLLARRMGGVFILRIEDTDRERSDPLMTQAILDGMTWLGLTWDEGPVHQADGTARHRQDALQMLAKGAAYRCFCTPAELEARRAAAGSSADAFRYDRHCAAIPPDDAAAREANGDPFTVRFRVPEGRTAWDDAVHGTIAFDNASIEDFIILRTDGTPIYNMAVVSDDVDMRITHVIRGDDHISNTPKQILLYQALNRDVPVFAHVPMILGPDGKRLSKRHGATAVGEYANEGILPEAMVNFLALLGWNPGTEQEVFTADELVAAFSLEGINRKSAIFDTKKLEWLNGQHIAGRSAAELAPIVTAGLETAGLATADSLASRTDWYHGLIDLLKIRARRMNELVQLATPYFTDDFPFDEAAVAKNWSDPATADRLEKVAARLRGVQPWEHAPLEEALRAEAEAQGIGAGKLIHPVRVALLGVAAGPGIFDVMTVLGRDRVLARLAAAQTRLDAARRA